MVVLNVPFAVLACICAALALPRPVEAAHLYGRQSTEKHTSVPHSQRLTRTRDSPFFGGSTAAQRHDDKSHGHQVSILTCSMSIRWFTTHCAGTGPPSLGTSAPVATLPRP